MLLFEDPLEKQLWLGKAIPREWLQPGTSPVVLEHAPTRYGRLSFSLQATSTTSISANITLPAAFLWPKGGIKLRVRSPSFIDGRHISRVTVAGKSWPSFNASEESIFMPHPCPGLQSIVVTLG
jgi:hypothetical protein